MVEKREGAVTLEGEPVTLLGPDLQVGDRAPEFIAVDREWNHVHLRDFEGKVVLISAAASVDTDLCAVQTQRFNEEASALPDGVAVIAISQDLPPALARFCGAEGVDRIRVLSDHVFSEFGMRYGVLIEQVRLLARSVWVIDGEGRVAYKELVPEVTDHPDYEAALAAAREVAAG